MQKKSGWLNKYSIIIAIVAVAVVSVGGVMAKYVYETFGRNVVAAKEFYFSSNLLSVEGKEYVLNSNASEISFFIGNNADNLRYSESDIKFTVSVETDAAVQPIVDTPAGVIPADGVNRAVITISNIVQGARYTVTAVGEAGYMQTLTASFSLAPDGENAYMTLAEDPLGNYLLFTVWTEDMIGEVEIQFPAGLIPDSTDPILNSVVNYVENTEGLGFYAEGKFTDRDSFALKDYSSRTYRFFVDDASSVTVYDFTAIFNGLHKASPQ